MFKGTLLIRADAGVGMGTGHVMRCVALAQAWQDAGGNAAFAMAESTPAVQARIVSEKFDAVSISEEQQDMRSTIDLARQEQAEWVVLDGYQFTAESQKALKRAGLKVLAIDDCGKAARYSADVVLNQNISAEEALYQDRQPYTRLLLGPRHALLRREFVAWRHWTREVAPHPRRLLVIMGGSDPQNVTARVIEALKVAGTKLDTTIVVGASNPHFPQLQQAMARSGANVHLSRDPQNLPKLMSDADIAISAAGSTCWELCLLGLPALLINVAANQTTLAKELHRRSCAIHIGDSAVAPGTIAQQLDSQIEVQECRSRLSHNSRALVDGNGARRAVSAVCEGKCLWLRPLTAQDRGLLFEWVNDPEVRAASFSSGVVNWKAHTQWFDKALASIASGQSAIFVAEDENGTSIGQIRFALRPDGDWEVGLSLASSVRGRGLASQLIQQGIGELLKRRQNVRVHAFVKPANGGSLKSFERSGFRSIGTEVVRGHEAVHWVYPASRLWGQ